jgi:hypothetical protein
MCSVDVTYGGGPDHQPCLIKLDGVPYDPADLARLGREVIALERDLATERQRVADLELDLAVARRQVAVLRQLDHLEAALEAMTVVELDSAYARVDSALVTELARMLAICLVKEDGTLYNVVSWRLDTIEPLGPMELLLQRTEGKTPAELRLETEERAERAEAALEALRVRMGVLEAAAGVECALIKEESDG